DRRFFRAVLGTPLVAWLVSSPLFFLAIDWGRFIYIHAMCMLIIVMCHEIQMRQQPSVPAAPVAPVRLGFVACAVSYITPWKVPHCCGRGLELTAFYQNVRLAHVVTISAVVMLIVAWRASQGAGAPRQAGAGDALSDANVRAPGPSTGPSAVDRSLP